MTTIYGGSENGLLNSSFAIIGRGDQVGPGDPGHGERVYVNSVNGNLVIQHQDAYLPSFGADFQLVRTYNQRGLPVDPERDGQRWSMSTSVFLSEMHDGPEVYYEVQYGDGSTFEYRRDVDTGLFVSTDGADSFETIEDLNVNGNTAPAFLLTRADQTVMAFNRHGDLISSVDPNGVRMDYFYQSNRLMTIQDDTGHQINYIYAQGKLERVEDETGAVLVQYGYQGGKLTEVTDRFGHTTTYHYSPQGELIRIELPFQQEVDGQTETYARREIEFSYEAINWADSNSSGGANAGLNYVVSQITDAEGRVTTFQYEFNNVDLLDPTPGPGPGHSGNGPPDGVPPGPPTSASSGNLHEGGNAGNWIDNEVGSTADNRPGDEQGNPPDSQSSRPGGRNPRFNINGDPFTGGRTTITDAAGNTLVYEYDSEGQVTSVTDQLGYETQYAYDEQGNLTAIVDRNAWGATNSDAPHFRAVRASLGVVDMAGLGVLVADLSESDIELLLAAFTTSMTYDDRGNLLTTTDNDGFVTTYTYTEFNKIESLLSGVGHALLNSDEAFYQDKRVELGFAATVAELDLDPAARAALQALYTTTYEYDDNQNLVERRDAGGDITRFDYDANGNRTHQIVFLDASDLLDLDKQQITQYFYDGFGNNIETIDPEGNHTFGTYDHFGNLTSYTDGNGNITNYVYDADNRLLSVTNDLQHTVVNTYDAVGNRTSITDENGNTVVRMYSQNNFLLGIFDPSDTDPAADRETTFTYDVVGNRTSTTDAEGRTITYEYNERRELVLVTTAEVLGADGDPGALVQYTTEYSYDGEGNRLSIRDRNDNLTQLLYTEGGLLEQRTDALGNVTRYVYDASNNQVQIIVGAQLPFARQQIVSFSFDEENQLVTRTDAESGRRVFSYDAPGNVASITDENGNTTEYEYDANNRLVLERSPEVYDPETDAMVQHEVARRYDGNGNQIEIIDARSNSTKYTFDADNRLVMIEDGNQIKTVYSYDSRDNRTSIQIGVSATADATGQVTVTDVSSAQVTSYEYDEFNQIVAKTDGVGNALAASDLPFYQALREELGYAALVGDLTAAQAQELRESYTERYTFDRVGNNLTVTDNEDRTTVRQYDTLNRLIKEMLPQARDADGNLLAQTSIERRYDGNGNLKTLIDQLGRASTYTYDANNRLVSSFDNRQVETLREYDEFGNLRFLTRAASYPTPPGVATLARQTEYIYDLNNRLTEEIDPLGHSTITRYDAVGNRVEVERVQDAGDLPQVTQYMYDALNRNIKIIDARSFGTSFEYDGAGNRVSIIDARDGTQRFDFDGGNRQIRLTDAENRVMEFDYDELGNRIEVRTGVGTDESQVTRFNYDAEGNLRSVVDAENGETTYGFDRVYNQTRATDANENVTTTAFDALNRAIVVTDALEGTRITRYDAVNNVVSRTDELGRETTYHYDAANRLTIETSPYVDPDSGLAVQTHYQYDEVGNRVSITRAANITGLASTAQFVYDLDDKLIQEIDGVGGITTYAYDANHNVTAVTDANGHALVTSNDQIYRDMRLALGDDPTLGRSFAEFVEDLSDDDRVALLAARTTRYEYNQNNQLERIIDPLGNSTIYSYDASGNRVQVTDQRGFKSITYYNANNEVALAVDAEGFASRFTYDANGNVATRTLFANALDVSTLSLDMQPAPIADSARDQTLTFDYDNLNRLTQRISGEGNITEYAYDAVGNRTETRVFRNQDNLTDVAISRSYYDELNRLRFTRTAEGYLLERAYDAVGNLKQQTLYENRVAVPTGGANPNPVVDAMDRTEIFNYDAANRLTSRITPLGAVVSFSYDARGNQLARTDEANEFSAARTTTFVYDRADRLTDTIDPPAVAGETGTVTHLELDSVGNVVVRSVAFGLGDQTQRDTQYQYDGNNRVISEVNAIGVQTRYFYDLSGNLSQRIEGINSLGLTGQRTETFEYDGNNRLTAGVNGELERTEFEYDAAGNDKTLTEGVGSPGDVRVTRFTYDRDNRLVMSIDANDIVTQQTFDGAGNRTALTEAYGITGVERTTQFQFDLDNRLRFETSELGSRIELRYDALGRIVSSIDANLNETVRKFDKEGNLLSITTPEQIRLTNTYDLRGNVLTSTQAFVGGADARRTTYEYDALDRRVLLTNGEGFSSRFTYDRFDNQIRIELGLYLPEPGDADFIQAKADLAFSLADEFVYDKIDQMTSTTDGNLNRREFTYDAVGNRVVTTAWANGGPANARVTTSQFDNAGRVTAVYGEEGGVVLNEYDEVGNLTRRDTLQSGDPDNLTDPDNVWIVEHFEYDGLGRQTATIDGMDIRNEVRYDAVGNITMVRRDVVNDVPTSTLEYRFDLDNRRIEEVDGNGMITSYEYDAAGNRIKATDALGKSAYYYFDRDNRQIAILDAEMFINEFRYDAASNVIATVSYATRYDGPIDMFTPPVPQIDTDNDKLVATDYDRDNNVLSIVDPVGTQTTYQHDSTGKLRQQYDFANTSAPRMQSFVYDNGGRLLEYTDVNGNRTEFAYDGANNKILETLTSANQSEVVRVTSFSYDKANRLIGQVFDPGTGGLNLTTANSYDRVGNLVTKTDSNGLMTTTTYDLNNRYVRIMDPLGNPIEIGYDARGNQISYTDAAGNRIDFEYDGNDRLRFERRPAVEVFEIGMAQPVTMRPTIETRYDAAGNVRQIIDANGNRTTRYYDGNRNVIAEVTTVGPNNNILREFTYNGTGKVLTETLYMDPVSDSAHDARPVAPTTGERYTITRTYDAGDRLLTETRPDILVTRLDTSNPDNPVFVAVMETPTATNTYDEFGREVENVDFNGNRQVFYYDDRGRLIASVDELGYMTEFEYDSQDNVTRKINYMDRLDITLVDIDNLVRPGGSIVDTTFIYDAANRNISESSALVTNYEAGNGPAFVNERVTTTYVYDGTGNERSRTIAAGTINARTEYSYYDSANRLIAVIDANRVLSTYERDANGNITRQARYLSPVAATYDLTDATTFAGFTVTNFVALGGSTLGDQVTENQYDNLGRRIRTTDLMGAAPDLSVRFRYDANGNTTWRQDENMVVSLRGYDGQDRTIRTISPDGSGSTVVYDAMGNDRLLWTGQVDNIIEPATASGVTFEVVGDVVTISWSAPTPGMGVPQTTSWVVWDVGTSHPDPGSYPSGNISGVQLTTTESGANTASFSLPVGALSPDQVIYFRVVSQDGGNNQKWTVEQSVLIPPEFTNLEVSQTGDQSYTVGVDFAGTLPGLPVLNYGTSSNLNGTVVFQQIGSSTRYEATISGVSDPQSLSYQIAWQDTRGNDFSSEIVPFEADTGHAGVHSTANFVGGSIDVSTRVLGATALQFFNTFQNAPLLQMRWRPVGGGVPSTTFALGTLSNGDYTFDFAGNQNIGAGSYEVEIFGTLASGTEFTLDKFVVSPGDMDVTHEAMAWALPQDASKIGADQLVILDGVRTDGIATRANGNLLLDLDAMGPASRTYDVFYGTYLTGNPYTVTVTQYYVTTPIADQNSADNYDPVTNPSGIDFDSQFDWRVSSYELQVDVPGLPPGAQVAWRAADSGSAFTNVESPGTRFSIPNQGNAPQDFDIKVFYNDTQGREVIVDWRRVTTVPSEPVGTIFIEDPAASAKDETLVDQASTVAILVLASETNANVTREAGGAISVDPGLYRGALIAEDRYETYGLNLATTQNDMAGESTFFSIDPVTGLPVPPEGYFVENKFNAMGHRIATNEGDGVWREFGVDFNGNIVATFRFGTQAAALAGWMNTDTDTAPIVTFARFDAKDREVETWGAAAPQRARTATTYDFAGRIKSTTDARGLITTFTYDGLGRKTHERRQAPGAGGALLFVDEQSYRYDRLGNLLAEIDRNTHMTIYEYDGLDRLTLQRTAVGNVTTFGLDAFGRRVRETRESANGLDAGDRVRVIDYDERNRVTRTINDAVAGGLNLTDLFRYDGRDNRIWTRDAKGAIWEQRYDVMGRIVETLSQQGTATVRERRAYDLFGNLTTTIDATGAQRTNRYSAFSRLASSSDEGGRTVSYTYDRFGRQIIEAGDLGAAAFGLKYITREYDAAGRVTLIQDVGTGISTTYSYDRAGSRLMEQTSTTPNPFTPLFGIHNRSVTYTYDALGQVMTWSNTVASSPDGVTPIVTYVVSATYMYDAAGNLKRSEGSSTATPDGETFRHDYLYDSDDRVTRITRNGGPAATDLSTFAYGYNEFDDRVSYTHTFYDNDDVFQSISYTYQYDSVGRVEQGNWSTGTGSDQQNFQTDWQYDGVGNVLRFTQFKIVGGSEPNEIITERIKLYYANNRNYQTTEFTENRTARTVTTLNFDLRGRLLTETIADTTDLQEGTGNNTGDTETKSFLYTHNYALDGRELSIVATGDANGSSTITHNSNDDVVAVNQGAGDDQDTEAVKYFVYNNENRIVFRYVDDGVDETEFVERTEFLYAMGKPVGDVDTNAENETSTTVDTGDYNLVQNIGGDFPSSAVTTIRANDGETLQSIAASVYGNPSLWFVIAEANGLSGNEALTDGQLILVPTTVQTGTLTSNTQVVYSEGDIIGSTLPNLTAPPQNSTEKCLAILAIILVIIVAIVVTIVTLGVGSVIAVPVAAAAGGGLIGAIAAAAVVGIVGAAIAFVGAVITQGILIGLTSQKEFDWLAVAGAVAGGFLAGAGAGLGALVNAGKIVTEVGLAFARVAQVALDVGAEVVSQLITSDPPGQIDSWASVAGAFLGSSLGVVGDAYGAAAAKADDAVEALTKNIDDINSGAIKFGDDVTKFSALGQKAVRLGPEKAAAAAAKKSVARVTTLQAAANIATGWVNLGEQAARGERIGPADFIATAGLTLGVAVNLGLTKIDVGGRFATREKAAQASRIDGIGDLTFRGRVLVEAGVRQQAARDSIDAMSSGLFGVGFLGNTPGANLSVVVQGLVGLIAGAASQDFEFGVNSAGFGSQPFIPVVATPETDPRPAAPEPPAPSPGPVASTPEPIAPAGATFPAPSSIDPLPGAIVPPAPEGIVALGGASSSANVAVQASIIGQLNSANPPPQIGPAVFAGGPASGALTTTNGLNGSTVIAAAAGNNSAPQQAAILAQQAIAGGTPPSTPSGVIAASPDQGLNGSSPLAQTDPVDFSNALLSQSEVATTIADHVNSIEMTGSGIRTNDVFGDPGAATKNDRVLGSLGANGKLGVPLPPREPNDAQTLALATPGVRMGDNRYSAAAPTSAAAAFALGAISSGAAGAALGLASAESTNQQYAAALSGIVTANQTSTPESASGVSLLAAAAGSGLLNPASVVAGRARALAVGTAVPWAYANSAGTNPAQGFGDRYNYVAGVDLGA